MSAHEIWTIRPDTIPRFEPVKEGLYENLPDDYQEEYTLGQYFRPDVAKTDDLVHSGLIVARSKTFAFTQERRYKKMFQPRLQAAQSEMIVQGNERGLELLNRLDLRLAKITADCQTNPDLLQAFRDDVLRHEHTHADQIFRHPRIAELNISDGILDSTYRPREVYRRHVLAVLSSREAQAYVKPNDVRDHRVELALSLISAKSVYMLGQWSGHLYDNALRGRIEQYESNIFGCLTLLTKDAFLLDHIWEGSIDMFELKQRVLGGLEQSLDDPVGFVAEISGRSFLTSVDTHIAANLDAALNEQSRLKAIKEL